jgi:hypothetical protein
MLALCYHGKSRHRNHHLHLNVAEENEAASKPLEEINQTILELET